MDPAALLLLAWLLLDTFGAVVTVWLLRRVWKRRHDIDFNTKLVASLVGAAATFGALGTLLGLVKAVGAVGGESVDPSQKVRVLAEGISGAMNCTELALAIWIPSVIATLIISRPSKPRVR